LWSPDQDDFLGIKAGIVEGKSPNLPGLFREGEIMDWEVELSKAVCEGEESKAAEIASEALSEGADARQLLEKGALAGIREAGRLWQEEKYFLPDIVMAIEAYEEAVKELEPCLSGRERPCKGRVLIGSVRGDAHDIGKNLIISLLRCSSYEVIDLGVDVPSRDFVDKTRELEPDVLGMGSFLTTTMRGMEDVIQILKDEGLRDRVKVIVGGAAVSRDYAAHIGCDGYGDNAAETVELVDELVGAREQGVYSPKLLISSSRHRELHFPRAG
jgi:5-methyltetrahydrofolate--homocysteine methyltransferase